MQIPDYHYANVRPVTGDYALDEDVSLKYINDNINDGINITFINALSSLQSASSNNFNTLYLTEPKYIHDILEIKTPKPSYPVYTCTYLKASSNNYWTFDPVTNMVMVTGTDTLDNRNFFELELLDNSTAAIRHYDGTNLKYLTLTPTNSSALKFETRNEAVNSLHDTQLFTYVLTDNSISLTSAIFNGSSLVEPSVIRFNDATDRISAHPIGTYLINTGYDTANRFEIRTAYTAPDSLDIQNTWLSYVSSGGSSLATADISSSHSSIQNNFITTTSTNELSTSMAMNLLPLKNQLTINGNQPRGNPYHTTENETTHRVYRGLHTGTHQEFGDDNISLNYISGVTDMIFPANNVTYFHMPSIIDPYVKLNVNDSQLIKCGAIAGDTPMRSDKIYKKRSDDHNLRNITDIIDNTWLCTWLSGNGDPASTPRWVDRYINPEVVTYSQGLSSTAYVSEYTSKVSSVIEKLSAQNIRIFDTLSELVFEPNALYAYHHIGNRDSERMILSLDGNTIVDDSSLSYKTMGGTSVDPEYIIDGPSHTMADGVPMTGEVHTSSSINIPKTYRFNNNRYVLTPTIDHRGSFSINFWMHNDDWTVPFGDQIVGNYTTHGIGIFNEPFVTPLITFPDSDKVHIYNSEYEYIDTHSVEVPITHFTRRGSTGNYWFVGNNNDIYEYNVAGIIQNKISSTHLTDKTIYDIEVDEDFVYAITGVEGNSARYFKFDLQNQVAGYQGESRSADIWNYSNLSSDYTLRIHSMKGGLSGNAYGYINTEAPVIIVGPDAGLSQGSVIDNYGYPWVIQNNYLYTYDTSVSSNIVGVSAAGTDSLECVNCDRSNSIWLLYGDSKIAKLDSDRNITFSTDLSSTPYQSTRYIDFVHEFTPNGYENQVTILNQTLSGCKGFVLDSSTGKVDTTTSILTGTAPVTHFATPLSSYSLKTSTGFDYIRKHQSTTRPRLDAKISLTNLYNSSTTTAAFSSYTLSVDLSTFDPGWHNICVNLDTENGLYSMYVDSALIDNIDLEAGKFAYNNAFTMPLTIGASPFLGTSLPISRTTNQPGYYYIDNAMINRLKIYNKALSVSDIQCHYNANNAISDVVWPLPTGQRSYVDTVERVFKHRLPGRRSEIFNINVNGISTTDTSFKEDMEVHIRKELDKVLPAYTRLNKLIWDNSDTLVQAATGTSVSVSAPITSSTSTSPGGSQSYGY